MNKVEDVRIILEIAESLGFKISNKDRLVELISEWRLEDEEAKAIRRKYADWEFINRQREPIKTALEVLVESGDLKMVSKLFNISLSELNQIRLRAKIPLILY